MQTLAKQPQPLAELEQFLAEYPAPPAPPVIHTFTPGLYSRRITLPKGLTCTSKIHKTTHQFTISKGLLKIWSEHEGWTLVQAPYDGLTYAGESRAVHVLEDAVWTTYHATEKTDVAEIERDLFEEHDIPHHKEGPCLK